MRPPKPKSRPCAYEDCGEAEYIRWNRVPSGTQQPYWNRYKYCTLHYRRRDPDHMLRRIYTAALSRVNGHCNSRLKKYYVGKPIMSRAIFMEWASNHPTFLALYKQYVSAGFPMSLAPTMNRIDSSGGYTLNNVEWLTHSSNCALAGTQKKINNRKSIYKILGVTK